MKLGCAHHDSAREATQARAEADAGKESCSLSACQSARVRSRIGWKPTVLAAGLSGSAYLMRATEAGPVPALTGGPAGVKTPVVESTVNGVMLSEPKFAT